MDNSGKLKSNLVSQTLKAVTVVVMFTNYFPELERNQFSNENYKLRWGLFPNTAPTQAKVVLVAHLVITSASQAECDKFDSRGWHQIFAFNGHSIIPKTCY